MPRSTTRSPRRTVVASGALLTALLSVPAATLSAAPALAGTTTPSSPAVSASATRTATASPVSTSTAGTSTAATATAGQSPATSATSTGPTGTGPTSTGPTSTSARSSLTPAPQRPLAAQPTGTAVERAAAYLAANLTDGDHVVGAFGTDLGQTADVVLALSSTTAQRDARDAAADYLAAHVDDYLHGAAFVGGEGGEKAGANYAGPTGKAIVAALAAGRDPRSFGGFDLVDELQGLMVTSGAKAGRFTDDSVFGDYSNPVGQAFDIIALRRATGSVPDVAVAYLLTAQCADGGFPDAYPTSPKSCVSNPDATGLALQALVAAGVTDATADASCAAGKALAWLRSHDASNGSYASGAVDPTSTPAPNVNSTAYAALGLTAATVTTAAQVSYLTSVQNPDGGLPVLPTSDDTSSNVLATAQALNALTGSTFLSLGDAPIAAAKPACTVTASPTSTSTTRPTSTRSSAPHGTAPADRSTVAAGAQGRLPRTGTDPFAPGLAGLALVLVGGAAVALTRRPRGARQ